MLDQVEADDSILVAVITGAGRSFVAGADIGQMSTLTAAEAGPISALAPEPTPTGCCSVGGRLSEKRRASGLNRTVLAVGSAWSDPPPPGHPGEP